ncbi:MAG: CBS domain-containing protein [Asticcacaulis sp.]|nr:CBS domain-containing protein [Asticcacaulis sp.]
MLTVHNVMTANPVRVTPDTTLVEAAKAMAEADVGFF